MIILFDNSQGTITVLADNGFPWKFSEKDPYVAKWFKLAEGGSICAVWPIFPEISHENKII